MVIIQTPFHMIVCYNIIVYYNYVIKHLQIYVILLLNVLSKKLKSSKL